jgi:hypothetical protein
MIVAMIVPPLRSQLFAKILDHFFSPKKVCRDLGYCDSMSAV